MSPMMVINVLSESELKVLLIENIHVVTSSITPNCNISAYAIIYMNFVCEK